MAEANTPEEQVKLNRHESPKRQAPAQLWRLSASLPTSAQLVASPA